MKNNKLIMKMTSGLLLCTTVLYTVPVFGFAKDETVYSNLKNNGERYNTVVSEKVSNPDRLNLISEMTDLLNIENTNGDETFTQDENKIVWNANGNDIYYKGNSEKELPVTCEIKYKLNDQEVSVDEIAGKSGKVTVTLEYKNNDAHIVRVNGKDETLYTPFVVVAGTVINNEKNRDIAITNGKAIDNGTKTIVMGMAMPGLQESLDVSKDTVDIPSNIEITMDAEDFEMSNIITYVTPKVIEKDDLDMFNKLDEVYSKVDALQSASNQLVDGANQLKDYTAQVATGAGTLSSSVDTASKGASQIKAEVEKSTKALTSDTSDALTTDQLTAIQNQASKTASDTIATQLEAIASKAGTDALKSLDTPNEKLGGATVRQYVQAIVKNIVEVKFASEETETVKKIKATALAGVDPVTVVTQAQALYTVPLTEEEKQLVIGVAQKTAVTTAVETAKTTALDTAKDTADSVLEKVVPMIAQEVSKTTASQVASQVAGQTAETVAKEVGNTAKATFTKQVASQMGTLGSSLGQLTSGLSQINNGAATLASVTKQVSDGANTLSEGMNTFNSTGVEKICNYINGDAKDLTERVRKLADLSKEYSTFTMSQDGEESDVKFIMIVDAIKKDEANKDNTKDAIVNENNNDNNNNNSQDETSEK